MTRLIWDRTSQRYFELGVDRGVLYPQSGAGVSWNGLTNVEETSTGTDIESFFVDGTVYHNATELIEFSARLDAFTYPDVFAEINGSKTLGNGLYFENQQRSEFGLSYRTLVGNDVSAERLGYKIHLLYNVTASPTQYSYATLDDSPSADPMSWDLKTRPIRRYEGLAPTSHIIIDSTNTHASVMKKIEDILYGTKNTNPRLPSFGELIDIHGSIWSLYIHKDYKTGLSELSVEQVPADLQTVDGFNTGLYSKPRSSRLYPVLSEGLFRLEN